MDIISDEKYESLWQQTRDFIDEHCIIRTKPGNTLPGKIPGTTYTWVFYLRNGLFRTDFLSAMTQMWAKKVAEEVGHFDFQLSGLETASTPMITAIPIYMQAFGVHINGYSIRKEQKTYALRNWIEGCPDYKPTMLLDDICNSGDSMRTAYDICKMYDLEVLPFAFSLVNKVNKGVHDDNFDKDFLMPPEIKLLHLYSLDDFNLTGNVKLH
jgi:orotate phosphoribosyltransferase